MHNMIVVCIITVVSVVGDITVVSCVTVVHAIVLRLYSYAWCHSVV